MKPLVARRGLREVLRDEDGFTLSEMLVTMLIMIVVLFALYSIFDMGLRIFSYGNDKIESTENARVALERMEREVRAAYPYAPSDKRRINASTSNASRITFFNNLNANQTGSDADETISYYVSGGNLMRQQGGGVAEQLAPLGPGGSLDFAYFDRTTGAAIGTLSTANEATVGMVRIRLVVVEDGASQDPRQELITNAALRNRGT